MSGRHGSLATASFNKADYVPSTSTARHVGSGWHKFFSICSMNLPMTAEQLTASRKSAAVCMRSVVPNCRCWYAHALLAAIPGVLFNTLAVTKALHKTVKGPSCVAWPSVFGLVLKKHATLFSQSLTTCGRQQTKPAARFDCERCYSTARFN